MKFLIRTCREVSRLLMERQSRRLGPLERIAVRLHLGVCEMCTRFSGQLRLMDQAMAHWRSYTETGEGPAERDAP